MGRYAILAEAVVPKQDTCPQMQQLIERLATKHQVDTSVAGVRLWLALPGTTERLLIAGLSGQRIGITHCLANAAEQLTCDIDLVCLVDEAGWQPIELLQSEGVEATYVQKQAATGAVQIQDSGENLDLARFAECWAEQLMRQRWLEEGHPVRV